MPVTAMQEEIWVKAASGNMVRLIVEFTPEGSCRYYVPLTKKDHGQLETLQTLEVWKRFFVASGIPHYSNTVEASNDSLMTGSITIVPKQ